MDSKLRVILVSVIAGLVGLIFVGIFVLLAIGRDVQQVTTFALIVLPLVIAAAGLGTLQVRNAEKLDTVAKNVNGNTTRLLDALDFYQSREREAARTGAVATVVESPISEDTIVRIREHNDKLPKHTD